MLGLLLEFLGLLEGLQLALLEFREFAELPLSLEVLLEEALHLVQVVLAGTLQLEFLR